MGDVVQVTGPISTSGINTPDSLYTKKRLIVQHKELIRNNRYSGLSTLGTVGRYFQETRGKLEKKLRILLIPSEGDILAGILFGVHAIENDSLRIQLSQSGLLYLVSVSSINLYSMSTACDRAQRCIFQAKSKYCDTYSLVFLSELGSYHTNNA